MSTLQLDDRGVIVTCANCGQRNRLPYDRLAQRPHCAKCQTEIGAPMEPINIEDETEFVALTTRSSLPVLVDFWADWCGPCKMIAPEMAKVAAQGAGKWVIAKVNTEALPDIATRFAVHSIPLLALFDKGVEVARQAGAMPAPDIRHFIERNL